MSRATALDQLLRSSPQLWNSRQVAEVRARDTGFSSLNSLLPGQGWPLGALIELLPKREGIGEMRLVLPALKKLCQEARDIVFVRPPHLPYPPALAKAGLPLNRIVWIDATSDEDARWVAEQTLRQGLVGAVLLWSDCTKDISLRRLQLAARESDALSFLYRSPQAATAASPAALRMTLSPLPAGLQIELLKVQGGRPARITLPPNLLPKPPSSEAA
ncbi:MAG TPA: translesion DNA synthesis-associated protein ImuA [Steroidobacteraceae bacterium]|nr:translesion DNA synthesis-associated protein ImuA [Steroidobacteraceae bacterium]